MNYQNKKVIYDCGWTKILTIVIPIITEREDENYYVACQT